MVCVESSESVCWELELNVGKGEEVRSEKEVREKLHSRLVRWEMEQLMDPIWRLTVGWKDGCFENGNWWYVVFLQLVHMCRQ